MLQRLMGITCLLGGFVLLIAALHERLRIRMLRDTAVFTGKVISLHSRCAAGDPSIRYHEATVAYAVSGTEYRSVLRIFPGEILPMPGTDIPLSCFPWHPERLRPVPQPPRRGMLRILCICCTVMIAAGTALCLPW